MNIDKIPAGKDVPNDINVIIEIPAQASPVKYEVDKDSGALLVDRFMATPMFYPCNYGFVPHTLSDDGDPVDVLVMSPHPLLSGSVIRCRPVGMLHMTDEAGEDAKLLAVPVSKLSPEYDGIQGPDDVSPLLLEQIRHFFEHYKELEPNKWVKVQGWDGADAARAEIESSIRRFQEKG
ncbi:inorganic diphosphatase [Ectothiorhodospira mobilis]|uniref:inorganic diphosphatase n=1 Tax=Ectothiorhodospira mobilis TaxID=195064 RepID=UPI00190641E2|nr:inorganic diphosphatase [Ectothiorhodospira mobilis]MBK1691231.1 inorganic pyrophosphatase [Ectothiorhodospira mobilis]